jgi:hypothetical protein
MFGKFVGVVAAFLVSASLAQCGASPDSGSFGYVSPSTVPNRQLIIGQTFNIRDVRSTTSPAIPYKQCLYSSIPEARNGSANEDSHFQMAFLGETKILNTTTRRIRHILV